MTRVSSSEVRCPPSGFGPGSYLLMVAKPAKVPFYLFDGTIDAAGPAALRDEGGGKGDKAIPAPGMPGVKG